MPEYKYRAVCHTICYWLENLWQPGEIYEGNVEPIKHFSKDGKADKNAPAPDHGSDPRSNLEIRDILKKKYQSTKPASWTRKQRWQALRGFETAAARDESTNPDTGSVQVETFTAKCGFEAKTNAGKIAHERQCDKCKEA